MPARFAPAAFGFVLFCLKSLLISAIAIFRNARYVDVFFSIRTGAWLLSSWIIALPVVLVVDRLARRIVGGVIKTDTGKA